jgi:sec-independent protein translocase protein TatA
MFEFQPWHIVVVAVVALLLFGSKRLPELGKGLGEGLKGFKEGLKGVTDPAPPSTTVQQTATAALPASTVAGSTSEKANMEYVTCSRCGGKFENPLGFKVADYVCRACQARS